MQVLQQFSGFDPIVRGARISAAATARQSAQACGGR